jgi:hypothetical protein
VSASADDAGQPGRDLIRHVVALRAAVDHYEQAGSVSALDVAFSHAGAAVALIRGARAAEPPEMDEVRRLFTELPEFEQLVAVAVEQAARSAQEAGTRLWQSFGLTSAPPGWTGAERSRAALLVACACAPLDARGLGWLRTRLLRLAADRWAELLACELRDAKEPLWRRALGPRYASVHQRCAPRTSRRTLGLSDVLGSDPRTYDILRVRLSRWLSEGGELDRVPAELEAAFVLGRTPGRLA